MNRLLRRVFDKHWYSICSRHRRYDPHCDLCQKGTWHINRWRTERIAREHRESRNRRDQRT